jgi:multiple sugar transport system permease protein
MNNKNKINITIYHMVVIAIGIMMVYPLVWMLMSSFKPSNTIFTTADKLITGEFTIINYLNGWKGFSHTTFLTFYKNTLIITGLATIGSLMSSSIVAFGLSRLKFPGRNLLFTLMLLTMMLPEQVLMIPQYLWYNKLGWLNSFLPLTVPYYFGIQGFFIYLMMNFISGIPSDLDEAAKIDGCSYYSIFTHIILPLVKPALATVAIFSFIYRWNDYMSPLLYLKRTDKYTISLALKLFCDQTSNSDYGALFAMSTLSLIPIFAIFASMQKYLTEGISTSGLKG